MSEAISCKLTSMLKFLVLPLTLLALCSCQKGPTLGPGDEDLLASAAENDCGFVQNSYGQRVSWKGNIPVRLKLHKDFPPDYEDALNKAAAHWNEAAGMTLFLFEHVSDTLPDAATKDSKNTIHWHLNWPNKNINYQGLTSLYWKTNKLYEADVAINNQHFNYFTGTNYTTIKDIHLESLLVHELGHVLGLKHRSTVPSVMWAVLNGGSIRDTLQKADRDTIKCEY